MSSGLVKYMKLGEATEIAGLAFYRRSLSQVKDENSRGLLKFLITEETMHLANFRKIIGDLKVEEDKSVMAFMRHKVKTPLFNKSAYSRIKGKKSVTINIFTTALQMEEDGIKLYQGMAEKLKDKAAKAFLLKLAGDEKRHFDAIRKHQESIYNLWYWEAMEQPKLET